MRKAASGRVGSNRRALTACRRPNANSCHGNPSRLSQAGSPRQCDRPRNRGAWRRHRPDSRQLAAHRVRQHRWGGALWREATARNSDPWRRPAPDRAATLQAECPADDVCVPQLVRDHLHDRLGLTFQGLGMLNLPNIRRPVAAFLPSSHVTAAAPGADQPITQLCAPRQSVHCLIALRQFERRSLAGVFRR